MGEHKCEWACRANGLQISQEGAVGRREVTGAKHQEMWTTLSNVGITTGTCERQATSLTIHPLYPNPAAEAVGLGPHHHNKYYTQQQGWMKSEDDEKKPMTRAICFPKARFSLLKSLCYLSRLQPPFFLTLNKGPISFLFSPCLTVVLLGVPSWSR